MLMNEHIGTQAMRMTLKEVRVNMALGGPFYIKDGFLEKYLKQNPNHLLHIHQ